MSKRGIILTAAGLCLYWSVAAVAADECWTANHRRSETLNFDGLGIFILGIPWNLTLFVAPEPADTDRANLIYFWVSLAGVAVNSVLFVLAVRWLDPRVFAKREVAEFVTTIKGK